VNAPTSLPRPRVIAHEAEPGYVLHTYPFKETSLLVELFTRNCGRVGLVAKGARRPMSSLRGNLMAFQPLLLSWSGKSELKVLHRAEWQGGRYQLAGLPLICGFYLNELLLKLLARDDPHEGLYAAYEEALTALHEASPLAVILRRFERQMLAELGYGLLLAQDAEGAPIDAQVNYVYAAERGAQRLDQPAIDDPRPVLSGRALMDIARDDYSDPATLLQARALMRYVISHHLGGTPLHTRQLLREMHQL